MEEPFKGLNIFNETFKKLRENSRADLRRLLKVK